MADCVIFPFPGCSETQRPDWLAARLRTMSVDENGPRFYVLRQPKGPDGTKGFKMASRSSVSSNGASAPKINGDAEALGNAWTTSKRISYDFAVTLLTLPRTYRRGWTNNERKKNEYRGKSHTSVLFSPFLAFVVKR